MESQNMRGIAEEEEEEKAGERGLFDDFEFDIERSKRLTSSLPPPESNIENSELYICI